MSEPKQYYWLKLQHDFFNSRRIKKLRKLDEHGDTYVIIYLKMQLAALQTGGIIEYTGVEPTFAEEMALELEENLEDVDRTIKYLIEKDLLQTNDNIDFLLPFVLENTGADTAAVQRGKRFRENMTEEQREQERERVRVAVHKNRERKKTEVCNEHVTNTVTNGNEHVTNVELEKEIEKELEIEKDIKDIGHAKTVRAAFIPPTLDEVKSYCWERGNNVNPEKFIDFYQSKGWMVGKNKMKDWKAAVRNWETRNAQDGQKSKGSSYTEAVMNRMDVIKEWAKSTDEGGVPFV